MMAGDQATETLTEFLKRLREAVLAQEGADAELASILAEKILTELPAKNCVDDANASIIEAAKRRANPVAAEDGHA